MKHICLYFQVHQPFRLKQMSFFDITSKVAYFDEELNKKIFDKVAAKCYEPANKLLLDLLKKYPEFKVTFSISGTMLDQFKRYAPHLIESFQKLVATGAVELLAETDSHSLAFVKSKDDFIGQVHAHEKKMLDTFAFRPKIFRNTELAYSNKIGNWIQSLGYKGILTEGADKVLNGRSPNRLYHYPEARKFKILLRNYRLSDDIAFRFSNSSWSGWPLTADKFAGWIKKLPANEKLINIFMDYETLGEHQWKTTGIFDFMQELPAQILKNNDSIFVTPSEALRKLRSKEIFSSITPISWADEQRDLSAWLGNHMQLEAFDFLYSLAGKVKKTTDHEIIQAWDYLQASDHFYYMSTKMSNDGTVHAYFSPYNSPHEAFTNYMNTLTNFEYRLDALLKG